MQHTLLSLWTDARHRLAAAGIDTPVIDARLLIEAGADVSRLDIVTDPHRALSAEASERVEALLQRRLAREPVAHILGRKGFWTIDLVVTADTLIPRPETEFVVQAALALAPRDAPFRVLDLGVGAGAILLAVLAERPLARGVGIDASAPALEVARHNARLLGMQDRASFQQGGWSAADGAFDLVVSNPPYVATVDLSTLAPEVQREPRLALDGGVDGLDAYRAIAPLLPGLLAPGGAFAFEVGAGQAAAVAALVRSVGLRVEAPGEDLAGVARVVLGRASG